MRFNLENYDDLGKCVGPWREFFDTEVDHIYVSSLDKDGKLISEELPVNSLEDLFKYLWAIPWLCTYSKDKGLSVCFGRKEPEPWWNSERERGWKNYCEERWDEVKNKIRKDNENVNTDKV